MAKKYNQADRDRILEKRLIAEKKKAMRDTMEERGVIPNKNV